LMWFMVPKFAPGADPDAANFATTTLDHDHAWRNVQSV
jgi:hypothetical protein